MLSSLLPLSWSAALLALAALLFLGACAGPAADRPATPGDGPVTITFLTREGCANTPVMAERLDLALTRLGSGFAVQLLDAATLSDLDPRTGFGTPTLLVHELDLFGAVSPGPATPT